MKSTEIETGLLLPAKSIHDVLLRQAAAIPHDIALEFMDRRITYREAWEKSHRVASGLRALGVNPGDRVAIMLPNVPEYLFAYYGALAAGAAVVLVNVMLLPGEVRYICENSGSKAMIALDRLLPSAYEGTRGLPDFKHMIVVGKPDQPGEIAFDSLIADAPADFTPHAPAPDDLALLVYTSGTTGKPKGAMVSHFNVLVTLASMLEMRKENRKIKALCVLPLFHVFGLIGLLNLVIQRGGTLLLQPRFEVEPVIDALKTKGVTDFAGTPTMFFHVLHHPSSIGASFPALVRCGSGGAPMPVEIRREWTERFGVDLTEGYGLSESTLSLSGYPDGILIKSGSVGIPNPGVEIKVVGDDGIEVTIGEPGEIVARGGNIMLGYWNNPDATAETLKDGWLHTGDIGFSDHHGYIFVVDRKKDMIIKGGYNVYPREIEEVIYQLPEIHMAAVIGIPDEAKGEQVEAVVSLKEGRATTPQAIMDHLRSKLAKYKLPGSVVIIPQLPVGPTGKILKRELKVRWKEIKPREPESDE